jgi:hypothetical protein
MKGVNQMKFILDYPEDLKKELKMYAADTNQTMNEVIIKAIKIHLRQQCIQSR